jgi:hypothetical protein
MPGRSLSTNVPQQLTITTTPLPHHFLFDWQIIAAGWDGETGSGLVLVGVNAQTAKYTRSEDAMATVVVPETLDLALLEITTASKSI